MPGTAEPDEAPMTNIIQRFAGGGEHPDNIDNIAGVPIKDHGGHPVTLILRDGVWWLQSHSPHGVDDDDDAFDEVIG